MNVVYQRQDSLRIMGLLQQARAMKKKPASWMLWFGKQMAGVPYVSGTLDRTKEEVLIVNTRELDCTTYVESQYGGCHFRKYFHLFFFIC